jgi:hypothetical protein
MGYWLWKYFKSLKAFDSDAQTEVFDLPKMGIISNLLVEIQATAGSTNIDVFMADAITKIEVIGNGSTVIQSLSGRQVQASAARDDHQLPPDKEYSPSGTCWGYFDIRFGRYPGDPKYALDCSKWASLELKITYALAAGATIGTTGFTTATGKIGITGLFSPDGAGLNPVGYIKKEQKKIYTSSANGSADLELPTDFPFRRIMMETQTRLGSVYGGFTNITVNINNGARKPIDNMLGGDLLLLDQALMGNPVFIHRKRYYLAAAINHLSTPVGWAVSAFIAEYVGTAHYLTALDPNDVGAQCGSVTSGGVVVLGYCPWRTLAIDLEAQTKKDGRDAMIDAWGYDQKADIHLEHIQSTASLAEAVVLEQYATSP